MKGQLESQHGKTNPIIFSSIFLGDAIDPFKVDNVQITHTKFINLVILFYFHC
jgi:hypothetical protein